MAEVKMDEDRKQPPIQTLRDGAIVVKLWRQDGKNGPYVTATLGRTYQNEETGEYGESRSLGGSEVLKAQALLGKANEEMIRWRDYYKKTERQLAPEPAAAPQRDAEPNTPVSDPAPGAPENNPASDSPEQGQRQGLAAQRDAALTNAKTPSRTRGIERTPER